MKIYCKIHDAKFIGRKCGKKNFIFLIEKTIGTKCEWTLFDYSHSNREKAGNK